jgi:hypothetical protein
MANEVPAPLSHEQIIALLNDKITKTEPGELFGMVVMTAMDARQSETMMEVARRQFERPAEEKTRREEIRQRGQTRRHGITEGKSYAALLSIIAIIAFRLVRQGQLDGWLVALVPLILAGPSGADLVERILKRFRLIDPA